MATFTGVNTTVATDTTSSLTISDGLYGSRLIVQTDTYTTDAMSNGETIGIAVLPENAKVVDIELWFSAWGTSRVLSIGDDDSDDRYGDIDVATAGRASMNDIGSLMYVVGTSVGDGNINLVLSGGAISSTVEVKSIVTYTL